MKTVKELIKALQKLPPDAEIRVDWEYYDERLANYIDSVYEVGITTDGNVYPPWEEEAATQKVYLISSRAKDEGNRHPKGLPDLTPS